MVGKRIFSEKFVTND